VNIQQRILNHITRMNWVLCIGASIIGLIVSEPDFARGIIFGGLIVTINFHLLSRTIKKALTPPHITSHNVVLFKYYIRFIASGSIIFILMATRCVDPIGLVAGLSVVVGSIIFATAIETKRIILKEAA